MLDVAWKRKEYAVAEKVGGRRFGIQEGDVAKVVSDNLALEVLMRKKLPRAEVNALDFARRFAGSYRLGGVVRTLTGSDDMYITFHLDDFCAWYVNAPKEEVTL